MTTTCLQAIDYMPEMHTSPISPFLCADVCLTSFGNTPYKLKGGDHRRRYTMQGVKARLWLDVNATGVYRPIVSLRSPPCVHRNGLTCASQTKCFNLMYRRRSREGCDWSAYLKKTDKTGLRLCRRDCVVIAFAPNQD